MKRKFMHYLVENKGYSKATVALHEQNLLLWQECHANKDFASFGSQQVTAFKKWLGEREGRKGKPVSLVYRYNILRLLRQFFEWLSVQPGYKSRINPYTIEALSLSKEESRIARQPNKRLLPSPAEIIKVIETIDIKSEVDRRDRALICFAWLTGARISAIYTMCIKAFDSLQLIAYQDPKLGVKTKFSKLITTTFFPIDYEPAKQHFLEWLKFLTEEKKFGPDDPIFPKTIIANGKENISLNSTGEVKPEYWSSSNPTRSIFERRFKEAGVPYRNPHTLRHLVVSELAKIQLSEEQKKAVSQNLGHENTATTFSSYGYYHIPEEKQVEIIKNISIEKKRIKDKSITDELMNQFTEFLNKKKEEQEGYEGSDPPEQV